MSIAAPVIPVLRGECLELAGQIVKVQGDSTSKNTGAALRVKVLLTYTLMEGVPTPVSCLLGANSMTPATKTTSGSTPGIREVEGKD